MAAATTRQRVVAGTADEGVVAFLAENEVVATAGVAEVVAARATAAGAARFAVEIVGRLVGRVAQANHDTLLDGLPRHGLEEDVAIGRASCRERGGKYV